MKKGLHKMGALALALLLTFTLLAGCGAERNRGEPSSSGASQSQQADSTSVNSGSDAPDPWADLEGALEGNLIVWVGEGLVETYYKDIAEQFEAETGMTVELVGYAGTTAIDKLALDGPAGNGGDVYMQGGGGSLSKAAEQGLFMPIPEDLFDLSRYVESSIPTYRYKGQLYGLPMGVECPALIYNRDLVDSIPDTWEDLVAQMNADTDFAGDRYGFLWDPSNFYFTMALIYGKGGYIFGEGADGELDVTDIGLDGPAAVEVYEQIAQYYNDGLLERNMAYDVMQTKFGEGKVLAVYDGPWAVAGYQAAGINVGVAPLPAFEDGGVPLTFSGGYGLAVSSFTNNPLAAFKFMELCMRDENVLAYATERNLIPPLKVNLESDIIKNDPVMSGFALQLVNTIAQPSVPETDQIWTPMVDAGLLIISDENADVPGILKQAVDLIRDQIASFM